VTLRQPNYDRMIQIGLYGMAEAYEEQYHVVLRAAAGFVVEKPARDARKGDLLRVGVLELVQLIFPK